MDQGVTQTPMEEEVVEEEEVVVVEEEVQEQRPGNHSSSRPHMDTFRFEHSNRTHQCWDRLCLDHQCRTRISWRGTWMALQNTNSSL